MWNLWLTRVSLYSFPVGRPNIWTAPNASENLYDLPTAPTLFILWIWILRKPPSKGKQFLRHCPVFQDCLFESLAESISLRINQDDIRKDQWLSQIISSRKMKHTLHSPHTITTTRPNTSTTPSRPTTPTIIRSGGSRRVLDEKVGGLWIIEVSVFRN